MLFLRYQPKKENNMANFTRSNLQYVYSWNAAKENDNARITGFPDSYLIDRHEGYEVLPYINRFMTYHNYTLLSTFHRIESAIRLDLPANIRGHASIKRWLETNYVF